jgi:hypothetical protein
MQSAPDKIMKLALPTLFAAVVLAIGASMLTQNRLVGADTRGDPTPGDAGQADAQSLEAKFAAALSNATFNGRWCLINDGKLGPDQEDKYTIIGAQKVGGDTWLIRTRIQYGERDFVAPLPVQVKWAGDTPVIVVENLAMPGGSRKYSARVVIHDDTYAGTWSGGDHAGLLMGVISRSQPQDDPAAGDSAENRPGSG